MSSLTKISRLMVPRSTSTRPARLAGFASGILVTSLFSGGRRGQVMYAPIVRRVDDSRAAVGPHVTEREPSGRGAGRGRQIGMLPPAAGERQLVNVAVDAAVDDGGDPVTPHVAHQNTLVEGLRGASGL